MVIRDIIPSGEIKRFAKEQIFGIKSYKTKRAKYFNIGWRVLIAFVIILTIFFSFTGFSFKAIGEKPAKIEFYPVECIVGDPEAELLGEGWQNPQKAEGKPDVLPTGSRESFSDGNSAVYKGGVGELICQNFNNQPIDNNETQGANNSEGFGGAFQSAKIYFSLAIDNNPPVDTNNKPNNTNNFSGASSNISDKLAGSEQDTLSNLDTKIIIWYSLDDGKTWYSVDKISSQPLSNFLNGGYFSYEAPFLKNWEDVKNLKIKLEGAIGGETDLIAFLDSVWVEVKYQIPKPSAVISNLPDEILNKNFPHLNYVFQDFKIDVSSNLPPALIQKKSDFQKSKNTYNLDSLIVSTEYSELKDVSLNLVLGQKPIKQIIKVINTANKSQKATITLRSKINAKKIFWDGKEYEVGPHPLKFQSYQQKKYLSKDVKGLPNYYYVETRGDNLAFLTQDENWNGIYNWQDIAKLQLNHQVLVYKNGKDVLMEVKIEIPLKPKETFVIDPIYDLDSTRNFNVRYYRDANWEVGTSVAIGDINNDGINDLVIGAYMYVITSTDGCAYAIFGDKVYEELGSGIERNIYAGNNNYNLRFQGHSGWIDNTGWDIAIGDLDDDGRNDLVIAAPMAELNNNPDGGDSGVVFTIPSENLASYTKSTLEQVIDLNTNAAVEYRIFGRGNSNPDPDMLGRRIAVGDVNGDGKDDLILGTDRVESYDGYIFVVYNDTYKNFTLASGVDTDRNNCVYIRNTSNYNVRFAKAASNGFFGISAIRVGDINGDGNGDLLMGAEFDDNSERTDNGAVYIVLSTAMPSGTGNDLNIDENYSVRYLGAASDDVLGNDVVVGDVNGDGNNDLILGAYKLDYNPGTLREDCGAVYVIDSSKIATSGSVDLATTSNWSQRFVGASGNDALGYHMEVGDLNGDGKDDLVMSAHGADTQSRTDNGAVYIIYSTKFVDFSDGQTIDLSNTDNFSVRFDGRQNSEMLGFGKGGHGFAIGDLNMDGRNDLVIGAQGGSREYVYVINGFGNYITPLQDTTNNLISVDNKDFTLVWDAVNAGGGIDEWYYKPDSVSENKISITADKNTLVGMEVKQGSPTSNEYHSCGDDITSGSDKAFEVLESTPTRTKVHARGAFEQMASSTELSDTRVDYEYSVYPTGKIATKGVRESPTQVSNRNEYSHMTLTVSDGTGYARDFIHGCQTMDEPIDWTQTTGLEDEIHMYSNTPGSNHTSDAVVVAYQDYFLPEDPEPGNTFVNVWNDNYFKNVYWLDNNTGQTWEADSSETFYHMVYIEPDTMNAYNNTNLTYRTYDYRNPRNISYTAGSAWQELGSDDFNESEGAYTMNMDTSNQRVVFDISGSSGAPIYQPVFKIRKHRSVVSPPYSGEVQLEDETLQAGADYNADVKPLTYSFLGSGSNTPGTLAYGEGTVQTPRYRQWDDYSKIMGSELTNTQSISQTSRWTVVRASPTRPEIALGVQDDQGHVNIQIYNVLTQTWGNLKEVTTAIGSTNSNRQAFDMQYETISGDLLVVFYNGTSGQVAYHIWNGSNWTDTAGTYTLPLSGVVYWVKLANHPRSDEMILGVMNATPRVMAAIWNGSQFNNGSSLGTSNASRSSASRCPFDVDYEQLSGYAVIEYGDVSATGALKFYRWNGSSWTNPGNPSAADAAVLAVRIASCAGTDRIASINMDSSTTSDVDTQVWNGSSWYNSYEVTAATDAKVSELIDVAFEQNSCYGIAVYGENDDRPRYRIWDPNSTGTNGGWSSTEYSALDTSASGGDPRWLELIAKPGTDEIMLIEEDDTWDLHGQRWDGDQWNHILASPYTMEDNLPPGSTNYFRPYSFAYGITEIDQISQAGLLTSESEYLAHPTRNYELNIDSGSYLYLGSDSKFNGLNIDLLTNGAGSAVLQWQYWSGDSWSNFTPSESESGAKDLKADGTIYWQDSDLSGWAKTSIESTTSLYYVRAYLSSGSWTTYPKERLIKTDILLVQYLGDPITTADQTFTIGIPPEGEGINIYGTSNLSGGTVAVAVNNALQEEKTGTISDGAWEIVGVNVDPGDIVTVWVDGAGEADESTAVTKYDGNGNITGMVLNANVLSLGSDDNASLSIADLGQYTNSDNEDVMHGVSGTAPNLTLTVDAGNSYNDETINIITTSTPVANTLTIGDTETLTTHNLVISGSGSTYSSLISGTSSTFNISGSWDNDGIFTSSGETINFTSSDSENMDFQGASDEDSDIYIAVFNGSGGQWNLTSPLIVNRKINILDGTLNLSSYDLTVGGSSGSDSGTITNSGAIVQSAGGTTIVKSVASGVPEIGGSGSTTFYNLTIGDSTDNLSYTFTRIGAGSFTVSNNLLITGGTSSGIHTFSISGTSEDFTVSKNVTINTRGEFISTAGTLYVGGNWSNSGTFTHNSGTVVFNGTSLQTFSGAMTGASSFYNLVITNNSGTNPDTDPSVVFSNSADATNATFTTDSTKIHFKDGSTYTFTNIEFNGQDAGTRLMLRSSSPGNQWYLVVNGNQTVLNTNVKDSNACGGDEIDATDSSNYDAGNNDCWIFKMLEFTISTTSIDFGTINPGELYTQNHTITTTTNAQNGFITRARAISSYGANVFRHQIYPDTYWIADWTGTNANPTPWTSGEGFGYHTNDYELMGGDEYDRFSPDNFAKFIVDPPGEPVADRTGPAFEAQNTITYKVGATTLNARGVYGTTIVFICTANY